MTVRDFLSNAFSYQELYKGGFMLQPNICYIYDLLNYVYSLFKDTTTKKAAKKTAESYQTETQIIKKIDKKATPVIIKLYLLFLSMQ